MGSIFQLGQCPWEEPFWIGELLKAEAMTVQSPPAEAGFKDVEPKKECPKNAELLL